MKEIKLTQGKVTIVDDEDFAMLGGMKWCFHPGKNGGGYAKRFGNVFIHQLILWVPFGYEVDHKNGNGLDNRRCNLRACTQKENAQNRRRRFGAASVFKGVKPSGTKWVAHFGRPSVYLGIFTTEQEAALAYDEAVLAAYGEFASTNIVAYGNGEHLPVDSAPSAARHLARFRTVQGDSWIEKDGENYTGDKPPFGGSLVE